MELSPHLVEEIADLEGLGIDLEEIFVEFKEGMTEQTKRKLSAGSPSAKLAGVEKAPKIDDAKSISATTVGIDLEEILVEFKEGVTEQTKR